MKLIIETKDPEILANMKKDKNIQREALIQLTELFVGEICGVTEGRVTWKVEEETKIIKGKK